MEQHGVHHPVIVQAMNTAIFHSRLGILGLSVRRFAAMTGVRSETARHWGVVGHGHPQEFPRWVPLMLEMMDPSVSRKPPSEPCGGHGRGSTTQGTILAGDNRLRGSALACGSTIPSRSRAIGRPPSR